jgi:hypothetical protein
MMRVLFIVFCGVGLGVAVAYLWATRHHGIMRNIFEEE